MPTINDCKYITVSEYLKEEQPELEYPDVEESEEENDTETEDEEETEENAETDYETEDFSSY